MSRSSPSLLTITFAWGLHALAALLWLTTILSVLGWLIGRIWTDETLITQYLYWVPTLMRLVGGAAALALAWALRSCARRLLRRPTPAAGVSGTRRGRAIGLYRVAAIGLVVMLAHFVFIEWRMFARGPQPRLGGDGVNSWRLSYWNVSGAERGAWVQNVLAAEPDLVIIANLWGYKSFLEFRDAFKGAKGPTPSVFFDPRFMVATRWPLVRWGATDLRLPQSEEAKKLGQDRFFRTDPGRAAFLELDVSECDALRSLGRPLVVWIIDLPSDISLHRPRVTRNAADAIATLGAAPMEYREGQWFATGNRVPFPAPDVIVGDFNIPRGSSSLANLAGGARDAYDIAGSGYAATFPSGRDEVLGVLARDPARASWFKQALAALLGRPWWKLDHAFVSSPCEVTGYRVLDPGSGTHRLQMLDIRTPR
ncbi:MAG: hypothetical protein SFY96_11485 [Planctomycetota bacterium]|nr:hypothetical protein [Planctomycetota bacterium]